MAEWDFSLDQLPRKRVLLTKLPQMVRPRSEKAAVTEKKVQEALAGLESGKYKNPHAAAKELGISESTMNRRAHGGLSRQEANEPNQFLTAGEETALVKWITQTTASGYPVRHSLLRDMALEIKKERAATVNDESEILVVYTPTGKEWSQRFLRRHPQLKTIIVRSIEAARLKETTREIVGNFFEIFKRTVEEEGILDENIHNMDESGNALGTIQAARAIIDSNVPMTYYAEPGRQEWVTTVECISADGDSIPPLIIFTGENTNGQWVPRNAPIGWHVTCNTKGWTSNDHGLKWLRECFEPSTREKAHGRKRILLCDGHDSHITAGFILHCIRNDIILMILPPHSSHLLQPLDVGYFGPLKTALSTQLDRLIRTGISRVQKAEWLEAYIKARAIALTRRNILSSWRGAGLVPFSPSGILRKLPLLRPGISTPPLSLPQTSGPFDDIPSSPESMIIRSANVQVRKLVLQRGVILPTPARKYIHQLTAHAEKQQANAAIFKREALEAKAVLGARKERKSGKRVVIAGHTIISTEEIYQKVAEAERNTRAKKVGKKGKASAQLVNTSSEEEEEEDQEPAPRVIRDCISVRTRRATSRRG
jgi:DDE superfamily endonuclease/Tc5 transposase DNA-binding domain